MSIDPLIRSLEMQLRDCRELLNQTNQELAALGNERDELRRYRDTWLSQGLPELGTDLIHALNDEGHRLIGSKESVSHFMAERKSARAAGAREALERAMQETGFSGTVVRVDLMREIIEQMEGEL